MTAKSLFQLAVLAVCLSAALGAIAPFSATDASRIEQLIRAQFQSSSATSDPALAHYSLAALSLLGKSDNSACNRIESALSSASGVDASHLVLAAEYAGCKVNSNAVKAALQASLDSGNIITASLAAQAVAKLAENKHAQLSNFKFDSAVSSAVGLMGNSGLFRSSEDGETSLYATGLAYQLVAIAYPALSGNAKSKAESVKDKVEKVLDKGGDDPVVIAFPINPVNQSVLASTAALFKGLHLLNDAFAKIDLHTERLSDRFAAFFLESKFVSKAEDATALISSLRILANNPEAVPIIISKASADSKTVRVTNVLDKLVTKAKVSLAKVQPVLGGSASGQGALSSSDDISYSLPSSLSAGVYRLKITVEPEKQLNGPSNIRTTSAFVDHKVAGAEIAAKEATLSTSGTADGKDIDSTKASFPSVAPKTLNGDNSKYLRVKVALTSSSQPAQAFVVLTHSSGNAGTFVAQLNGQNVESAIDLGAPAVSGALWGSGEYSVEVLVADALSPKQLSWKIGTVQLTIADSAALTASKAKAKEEEDNTKEKFHTFRSEGSRPPVLISLIFAVLVVLPLAAFVYALPSFGVKLHFPESASGFLWTALFQLSILSLLVLILLYWLKLNIFQALAGLAVLGSFTVFSGNRALRASSEMSVAHQKSE